MGAGGRCGALAANEANTKRAELEGQSWVAVT